MLYKQVSACTTGLFVNYLIPTNLVPLDFNSISARPDSIASILANKTLVFSDEVVKEDIFCDQP